MNILAVGTGSNASLGIFWRIKSETIFDAGHLSRSFTPCWQLSLAARDTNLEQWAQWSYNQCPPQFLRLCTFQLWHRVKMCLPLMDIQYRLLQDVLIMLGSRWAVYTQVSCLKHVHVWMFETCAWLQRWSSTLQSQNLFLLYCSHGYCLQNSSQWPFVSRYRPCRAQFCDPWCNSSNIPMPTLQTRAVE